MAPMPVETVAEESREQRPEKTEPAKEAPPTLTYDLEPGRSPVSRRQFRVLLILTLVNTLMLGAFVAGPGLSKLVGGWWRDYKGWQAGRAAAKQARQIRAQFEADYRKLLSHADPPDKVVYEEDADRARNLADATGYAVGRTTGRGFVYLIPKPWQFPVKAQHPALMLSMQSGPNPAAAPLFVGGLKSPSGEERLVVVTLDCEVSSETISLADFHPPEGTSQRRSWIGTERMISFATFRPHDRDTTLVGTAYRRLQIQQPPERRALVKWTKTTSWENGRIEVEPGQVMRFFAGQVDPADPSHFTIRYEMNGVVGWFDGWLRDDGNVVLEPRAGRVVQSDPRGLTRVWNPYAEPAPRATTGPSTNRR